MIRRSSGRASPSVRPAVQRLGARPGGAGRRTRPVRRASAGLTPVRAGAVLALLAGAAAVYGLASSDAFAARRTVITGLTWTPEAAVLAAMDVPAGENVFTIETGDLARRVAAIPAVASATVTIALPDEVRVAVSERVALLAWRIGAHTYLVDGDGLLFAELGPDAQAAAADLPAVTDARLSSMVLGIGSALDPVTLDAALRLGSLTPADVGSGARDLVLRVDDANGFTMRTRPAAWTAVFGFYTPTLRTPELVPGQVRLLRSLLAGREDGVERVILADDHSGTYIPRESLEPAKTPKPAKSPKPTDTPKPAKTPKPTKAPTP